jgi:hypothetical protein
MKVYPKYHRVYITRKTKLHIFKGYQVINKDINIWANIDANRSTIKSPKHNLLDELENIVMPQAI